MKHKGVWLSLLLIGLTTWIACSAASTGNNQQATVNEAKKSEPTPGPTPQPRPYSTDLDGLRAQFNRDKGKVRLVTLLSPT
jgi:hypothetical protein